MFICLHARELPTKAWSTGTFPEVAYSRYRIRIVQGRVRKDKRARRSRQASVHLPLRPLQARSRCAGSSLAGQGKNASLAWPGQMLAKLLWQRGFERKKLAWQLKQLVRSCYSNEKLHWKPQGAIWVQSLGDGAHVGELVKNLGCTGGGARFWASCTVCLSCLRAVFIQTFSRTTFLLPSSTLGVATGLLAS